MRILILSLNFYFGSEVTGTRLCDPGAWSLPPTPPATLGQVLSSSLPSRTLAALCPWRGSWAQAWGGAVLGGPGTFEALHTSASVPMCLREHDIK